MRARRLVFRVHAIQRMFRRGISQAEVRAVLEAGEIIEDYPADTPYPSQLLLGWSGKQPIHVVAAYNVMDDEAIVVTAYVPDPAQWDAAFKGRLA